MPSSASTDPNKAAALNGHPRGGKTPSSRSKKSSTAKATSKPSKLASDALPSSSTDLLASIFENLPSGGGPLRWGLAAAVGGPIDPRRIALSELGCGKSIPKKLGSFDIIAELDLLLTQIDQAVATPNPELACVVDAVIWAYALPMIEKTIDAAAINSLNASLEQLARHCGAIADVSSLQRLIGGGELALVLAWQRKKQVTKEWLTEAVDCVKQWCESPEPSIGFAVRGEFPSDANEVTGPNQRRGSHARAVLASLLRSRALCAKVGKQKLKKLQLDTIADLATWIAAATRVGGTAAFSTAVSRDVRDDIAPGGLLDQLKMLDPDTLGPAIDAAAGRTHSGGRLAWQISLPEAYCHSELGGTAIFLPEWDVRRGRMHLDYGGDEVRIEVDAGKMSAIDGVWELLIQVDGQEQAKAAPWSSVCEYTDDDVHYLELEQRWTGGIKVQRHLLLIREDRCVMLADAVIRDPEQPPASINYTSRLKLADGVSTSTEDETTEVWLTDEKGETRGLALSLQSNEWRVGPTRAKLDVTPDANLRLVVRSDKRNAHGGGVFAPMWFDFQQRRFKRPRTWRQLTVAEELRIVDPDESVAFRIQQGSEQWIVYRMLHGDRTRTFVGKHLLADLYCARFNASDGTLEDMLTVGGTDDDDLSE